MKYEGCDGEYNSSTEFHLTPSVLILITASATNLYDRYTPDYILYSRTIHNFHHDKDSLHG